MLDAALRYTKLGLAVFPCFAPACNASGMVTGDCTCPRTHPSRDQTTGACRDVGKHPRTRHGHHHATRDPGQIARWWRWWPDANPALACRPSGLVVPDIDPRNGGDNSLVGLEYQHGPLPATWRSLTGGGGLHIVYAAPADVVLIDGTLAPGIDFKANGYIVVPPALHVSGKRYTWEIGYEPSSLPLAPLPEWLLAQRRVAGSQRLRTDGSPLVIRDGERNQRLFQLACAWRRYGLNAEALRGCLDAVNRVHVQPPLSDNELANIAASATRYLPRAATVPENSGGASHTHRVRVV